MTYAAVVLVVLVDSLSISVRPIHAAEITDNHDVLGTARLAFPEERAGADPSHPGSYPFLPPNVALPNTPSRTANPQPMGIDLAAHLPYAVTTTTPDELWHQQETSYPDWGQLTDERLGTLSFTDSAWAGYQYQYVHDITIDLKHPAEIRAIALDCLQNLGAGIVFPDKVRYFGSQDGTHFTLVGTVKKPRRMIGRPADFRPHSFAYELSDVHANFRYVRAEFTNKVWAFIDEFAVYGWPGIHPTASFPEAATARVEPGDRNPGYAKSEVGTSAGIQNMLLVYTHGHGSLGDWRTNDFLPMLRESIDGSGNGETKPESPLFDTVMFTPYRLATSSAAWEGWLNDLFSKNKQLDALNDAVGRLEHRRWWRPFATVKERVVITIPAMNPGSVFRLPAGPLNLSSTHLHPEQAVLNREAVVDWYVNQLMNRWRLSHFTHLQLVGLCWQPESLSVIDETDQDVIRFSATKVHRQHLRFVWIPFYGAVGASEWKTLGFDLAILQPNVSFQWYTDPMKRFRSAALFAKQHGLGMEMEAHWDVISNQRKYADMAQGLYFTYFAAARKFGFDHRNVVKAWYMNSKTLLTAANSTDPYYRRVYDGTVRFLRSRSD